MAKITFEDVLKVIPQYKEYENYVSTTCPWHIDENPSLLVFRDGFVRCLACGRTGSLRSLYDACKGQLQISPKIEVVDYNTPTFRGNVKEQEQFVSDSHSTLMRWDVSLGWYLHQRNLQDRIEPLLLGWHNGWIVIPIWDRQHKYLGMVWRSGPHIQRYSRENGREMRYWMPSKQPPLLYVPDWRLWDTFSTVFITFGMLDAVALNKLRLPVATPTTGKGGLQLSGMVGVRKRIVFLPDKGEEETARKYISHLGWRGVLHSLNYPNGFKDPADYVENGREQDLYNELAQYIV